MTRFENLLNRCFVEVRVIRACDHALMTNTPLPAKPSDEGEAFKVLRDLQYLAWEMEGRRQRLTSFYAVG